MTLKGVGGQNDGNIDTCMKCHEEIKYFVYLHKTNERTFKRRKKYNFIRKLTQLKTDIMIKNKQTNSPTFQSTDTGLACQQNTQSTQSMVLGKQGHLKEEETE